MPSFCRLQYEKWGEGLDVMCATADVTFSLGLFSPVHSSFPEFSLFFSFQFVLRVRLLLDQLWLVTVRDISSGTHHVINPSRPSPWFSYCKWQKLGMEAWERG